MRETERYRDRRTETDGQRESKRQKDRQKHRYGLKDRRIESEGVWHRHRGRPLENKVTKYYVPTYLLPVVS